MNWNDERTLDKVIVSPERTEGPDDKARSGTNLIVNHDDRDYEYQPDSRRNSSRT
jgi:hypothetical protein